MDAPLPSGFSLTVALLMYNEEANVGRALESTARFLQANVDDWEIIVVDDGSTDGCGPIVRDFMAAEGTGRVRMVSHGTNRGMGAGISTGIRNATKEWFTYNATDGQIPAVELRRMIPLTAKAPIVLTTYEGGRGSAGRALLSRSFRILMRAWASVTFDLEGIYLIRTEIARSLEPLVRSKTFFFSFELIQRAIDSGNGHTTTSIRCLPRETGASKVVNLRRISRVSADVLGFGMSRRLGI